MGVIQDRHRIIAAQPHSVTLSGGVVAFETDMVGIISVSGTGNITVAGRNLYDYTQCKNGYYMNTSGVETASTTGWAISPYIKVSGLSTLTYFGITISGSSPSSAWYRADKSLLAVFKQETGRNLLTVPEGAVYVRFSLLYRNNASIYDRDDFCIMPGNTDAEFEAYSGSSVLKARAGYNTVWSDAGDISVTYWKH